MNKQEKQRATHLMILLCYTIFAIVLIGESILLGWDMGAVVLLLLGILISWGLHITGIVSQQSRLWLYFTLNMLAFFFYGIHESSIYDLAPVMIGIILLYSTTEMYNIIWLCVLTYYLTMCYDLVFVLGASAVITPLSVTRTLLHLALVGMSGRLARIAIQRHGQEKKDMDDRIAELEETNRRTEDFLANVSHELRTPINAVTGITAVMLKNEQDASKRKDILSVQKAGNRLFNQIEDILDYSEIDSGRIKVSNEVYMISSIVNDIITGNRISMKENNLELIFDLDADIPSALIGDGRKIRKILMHLIDNAIKFTQKGGVYIRIYALPKNYGVNLCIRVSDTGCGIAREELKKITERFYQSNGGRNRRAGGLGLGLPIVYGMVNVMEGFMQLESSPGTGTTVSISIPQKVSEETPCMAVANKENLCLACFLRPEKYEVPKVRDFYNEMISHMVHGLDIPLHRAFDINELEKIISMCRLTHLFIGKEEYESSQAYFEGLDKNIEVAVVADEDFALPQGSRARILRKPFYSFTIAGMLNACARQEAEMFEEKRMICPKVKALVVDDEPMNLMVAEEIFKGYQMKVKTAESGKEAIALCEREDFDLIFLDHMMPEMDGVETLKRLRKINTDFTIIALTANAVSGAREMFLQEGFDEFVSKPIEYLELERAMRKVLPKSLIEYGDEEAAPKEEPYSGESPNEESSGEDWISNLENAGIHTESGLQYCQGDMEFYTQLLRKFAQDEGRKSEEIKECYMKEDFENYRIRVHALKSTAKMIGADSLSELSRLAEEAAKNHDGNYIREHHEELLINYRETVQHILDEFACGESASAREEPNNCIEITTDELLLQLEELKSCLETYEADRAEKLISKLCEFTHQGVAMTELLRDAAQDVDDFEIDAAFEKVSAIFDNMKGGVA